MYRVNPAEFDLHMHAVAPQEDVSIYSTRRNGLRVYPVEAAILMQLQHTQVLDYNQSQL